MASPLNDLKTTNRVLKRAQYEAFTFSIGDDGVIVRNESHAAPDDHEYHVTVDHGIPVACDCAADEHYEWACKHRAAVAIREPVIAAMTYRQAAADGGRIDTSDNPTPDVEE